MYGGLNARGERLPDYYDICELEPFYEKASVVSPGLTFAGDWKDFSAFPVVTCMLLRDRMKEGERLSVRIREVVIEPEDHVFDSFYEKAFPDGIEADSLQVIRLNYVPGRYYRIRDYIKSTFACQFPGFEPRFPIPKMKHHRLLLFYTNPQSRSTVCFSMGRTGGEFSTPGNYDVYPVIPYLVPWLFHEQPVNKEECGLILQACYSPKCLKCWAKTALLSTGD